MVRKRGGEEFIDAETRARAREGVDGDGGGESRGARDGSDVRVHAEPGESREEWG